MSDPAPSNDSAIPNVDDSTNVPAEASKEDKNTVAEVTKLMHSTKLEGGKSAWATTLETFSMAEGKNKDGDVVCKTVEGGIKALREMIDAIKQDTDHKKWHFPYTPFKDFGATMEQLLKAFITWSAKEDKPGFNVSKAFRRLDSYVTWMDQNSKDLEEPLTAQSVGSHYATWGMSATHDKQNRLVWWIDLGSIDLEKVKSTPAAESLRFFVWISHAVLFDNDCQENGMLMAESFSANMSAWEMFTMVPMELGAKLDRLTIGVLPIKMKKIFILLAPGWLRVLMAIMGPFLSKKMRQRMIVVKKNEDPQTILDEEFGREGIYPKFAGLEGKADKDIFGELLSKAGPVNAEEEELEA
eukprot:CAMPEP_0194066402 /NCGR_PEP_ID=MMETSP0009_2-20130614/86002_1 /TAXON_ID=210454 /ORGANISM="Grammatophora oceanica, Strain CCMP 410" /LENGTH=354 /DNA_ID=CAMNT_0038719351 /DNA_START=93 /DNA_END=1157 /DNA_ORIENTATION=+